MKKAKILSLLLVACIGLAGCQEKETYVSVREKNKKIRMENERKEEEKKKEAEQKKEEEQLEKKEKAKKDENGYKIAKISEDIVNVRELPDSRAGKLITLEKGNEISVIKNAEVNGEEWTEILVKGQKGYVLTKFIEY